MFKSLIATCLFTISCSSGAIKRDNPSRAVGSSVVLRGAYTLNDSYDFNNFQNYCEENHLFNYTMTISTVNRNDMTWFGCFDGDWTTYDLEEINITYYHFSNIDNSHVNVNFSSSRVEMQQTWFDIFNDYEIEDTDNEGDVTDFLQNMVFSFNIEYYLSSTGDILLFNTLFNKSGNRFVNYYNGYYHFNNGTWYVNEYDGLYYDFASMYMFQSYIFNSFHYDSAQVSFDSLYKDGSVQSAVYVLDHSKYTDVGNITIQGLLPKRVRNCLDAVGVFQFVPSSADSTWYDMMLATMDAPIYYITSLLDFKLFGMNLFIAFGSLITLVICIAILKRVI